MRDEAETGRIHPLPAPKPEETLPIATDSAEKDEVFFSQYHLFLAALEQDQPERTGGGEQSHRFNLSPKNAPEVQSHKSEKELGKSSVPRGAGCARCQVFL